MAEIDFSSVNPYSHRRADKVTIATLTMPRTGVMETHIARIQRVLTAVSLPLVGEEPMPRASLKVDRKDECPTFVFFGREKDEGYKMSDFLAEILKSGMFKSYRIVYVGDSPLNGNAGNLWRDLTSKAANNKPLQWVTDLEVFIDHWEVDRMKAYFRSFGARFADGSGGNVKRFEALPLDAVIAKIFDDEVCKCLYRRQLLFVQMLKMRFNLRGAIGMFSGGMELFSMMGVETLRITGKAKLADKKERIVPLYKCYGLDIKTTVLQEDGKGNLRVVIEDLQDFVATT